MIYNLLYSLSVHNNLSFAKSLSLNGLVLKQSTDCYATKRAVHAIVAVLPSCYVLNLTLVFQVFDISCDENT